MSHPDWRLPLRRVALLFVLLAPSAGAEELPIALAPGTGRETVQASCGMCHSLDYIVINSPFQDQAAWEKTVRKMVNVMGAPLSEEQVQAIVAYLSQHYAGL
ncbi:MAG: cytochrome c [Gammaproteobacteria bacterium]|nr:cytochrome c [Gammaproteobacteria bacterium]